MKQRIDIENILLYYDGPEIFLGRNVLGNKFLSVRVSNDFEALAYIATQISDNKLVSFLQGEVDLRNLLLHPEIEAWFILTPNHEFFIADLWDHEDLPEKYLPEAGFYFSESDLPESESESKSLILHETVSYGKPIVHISITDSSNGQSNSIDLQNLGDISRYYSKLFTTNYRKSINNSTLEKSVKKLYLSPENSNVRAFETSNGSFKIHLFSTAIVDVFGKSPVEYGLNKLEELLGDFETDDIYIKTLRSVRGHTITALRNLVKLVADRQLSIVHEWSSLDYIVRKPLVLDKERAARIYSIITSTEELETEERIFEGTFSRVDVKSGSWRIFNKEDAKEYHGDSDPILLRGITIHSITYRLICKEIIEENTVDQTEKPKFVLKYLTLLE